MHLYTFDRFIDHIDDLKHIAESIDNTEALERTMLSEEEKTKRPYN